MGRSSNNANINIKSITKPKPAQVGTTIDELIKQLGVDPNLFGINSNQKLLNIIRGAFEEEVNNSEFPNKLRLIKEHFFNREYIKIFENPNYLACYCLNYIPGRSLCYFNMFLQNEPLRNLLKGELKIFAMGAGAGSELVGVSGAGSVMYNKNQKINLHTQDIADWSRELNCLENSLRNQLGENMSGLETKFSIGSVLNIDADLEKNINESDLITAMFVINELFVEKSNAMKLITLLISQMKSGSHLLIVDSAGSFSHLKINGKTYMVHQLLDNLKNHFEPLIQKDSEWYRIPNNINFPLPIQNMRYFIRLYKRL